MTLSGDNRPPRPEQTRTQKIVMWCIYAAAAVLLIVAAVLFFSSGARLF